MCVDVTIPRRSFVLGQWRAEVSASFINVRSLAVAAFDLVYCSLSVPRFVFVLDISKQKIARILQPYNIRVAHKPITILRRLLSTFTRTIKLNLLLK